MDMTIQTEALYSFMSKTIKEKPVEEFNFLANDDKTLLDFGTGALREIVSALQVIQSANRIAVSKGLAAIVINNPFFNT